MNRERSQALFERAQKVLPGGVNSPVRAYRSVGGTPPFLVRGAGSRVWDADGNEYIDFIGSWGPLILGHSDPRVLKAVQAAMENGLSFGAPTPIEVDVAELLVDMVPNIDMVRMVNSGTEAVMSAVRVARGVTGRTKIIKFAGCYHGHSDAMLVKAGSGALTGGAPDSKGVPQAVAADTLTAQYNDLESVEALMQANPQAVAAVIVEPVAANMGVIAPKSGFLQGLRTLCDRYGALLIFDEVITGFRLARGGAQEYFGVRADLVTFGKIIGGGMPVGAYAGKREIMSQVAPTGPIYQAGTLSGNPVAMAAGLTQLQILQANPQYYSELECKAQRMAQGLRHAAQQAGVAVQVNQCGALLCPYFTDAPVQCFADTQKSDLDRFRTYFQGMLARNLYIAPSQYEATFVNVSHTEEDLETFCQAAEQVMQELRV
ncbi:MAG: glutamate-1-semialdehyde 2,1-aminomutase [Butyricicoccus pullicaecorum]|nr:glutamate-1-semialdehyde 2,1-aminomutase [Butyricicoccus pullicaecorum]MDO4668610.1 glutamate-1-semialdehyde 2,1-aminomutase [Butyricicoccus pullicaecorum]